MTVLGDYELLTRLASGGMAEVFVARSRVNGDIVIVKQMLQKFVNNPEFVEMFLDEGRVISQLSHPNVVSMRSFGFHDDLPYLAMEYLHGVDLRTLMRTLALRRRMMPIEAVIYIISCICAGLHHAHNAHTIDNRPMDIIHRDVSPQNVVITFDGGVKLIDFGIAKARGRSHETRSGALKGKVPYMSPEQVRSGKIDRRTDVYAVGVMLYELIVGRRPYVGNKANGLDEFGLMMAIVNHDIVPASAVRAGLHPKLNAVIMKALEVQAADRYQSADELRNALVAVAQELDMVATPEQLAGLMVRTLGQRISWAEAARSNERIVEQVSSLEHCKTTVDERHDPLTVDPSEVAPELRLKTGEAQRPGKPNVTDVSAQSSPVVDKVVDANVTRLKFRRPIDSGFRWGRLLDGIEGVVEIDFSNSPELTSVSTSSAADAVRRLGSEVSEIRLIAAPISLATQLEQRCTILSVAASGRCTNCNEPRSVVISPEELRSRLAHGSAIRCPRCGTSLDLALPPVPAPDVVARGPVTAPAPVATPEPPPPAPLPLPEPAITPVATARPSLISRERVRKIAPIAAGAIAAIAVGVVLARSTSSTPKPAPPRPPAGAGKSWQDGDLLIAEAKATGATEASAVASARARAIRVLIASIETAVPPPPRSALSRATDLEVVANVEAQLGGEIQFRSQVSTSAAQSSGFEATSRYALSRGDFDRAVKFYRAERDAWGMRLRNAPPSLRPGVIVIGGPGPGGVTVGDRIVSANREPVLSVEMISDELAMKPTIEVVSEQQRPLTLGSRD
ncbi:MAG: serine/threonine-protein kinase [Kofleriaceae bacterium]